ncbi:MAG: hypothetical protein FJW35_19120, partial [Acidobacteria bacterium]|nr:hypothetical protein [Acidobacteriota bacterium]
GTVFLSARFFGLFRFALDEAARLGIRITAIPSNGWYQGGPWVTPEMGPQMLVWSRIECRGPNSNGLTLPVPDHHRTGRHARIARGAINHLKPVAVMAFQQDAKGHLLGDSRVDLSRRISTSGELDWALPAGHWVIYRFAHVPNLALMKQDSPGYGGFQIDHMSRAAMERHLQEVAVPMLKAAGPHAGNTLDRLHQDSMEIGYYDWTPLLPEKFKARRGYDLIPLLPLLAGDSFTDGPPADRVEHDFEELLKDLLIDEHYGTLRAFCHRNGLTLVAESGETGSGIRLKGASVDHVMDEFWTHYGVGADFVFNRNGAFAAQVYGQNRFTCEAFTSHQQWLETPAQLKALANEVFAQGLNHLTIHGFSSSPKTTPAPGDVYFAGTHYNPGVTWWNGFARPLTAFFNRCQAMLTAGLPVVDMLYIDGPALQERIKTNEMLWESDRRFWKAAGIPGELLAKRASVDAAGRIEIPNGPSYSVLVVADTDIKREAMRAVVRLVEQGATVWFQAIPDR